MRAVLINASGTDLYAGKQVKLLVRSGRAGKAGCRSGFRRFDVNLHFFWGWRGVSIDEKLS